MSCSNCAKTFSIFTKEKSCKNCGFAFCSNCLKRKKIIPKTGMEGNVCGGCEKTINMKQATRPPPDALQRRLDFLENPPAKNPITVYTHNKKMSNLKKGLSVEDKAIADRLENLQRDRKASMNIPTEAEMEERLLKLKDRPPISDHLAKKTDNKNLLKTDDRSEVQKTKDLLEQANAEVQLENKMPKPEDEIRDRLAKLRGQEIITHTEPMDISPAVFLNNPSAIKIGQKQENMADLCKLLDEVSMEVENDASIALKEFESDKDLQEKFSKIMKQKSNNDHENDKSDSEQDEEEAKKVMIGVLSEQKLEEQLMEDGELKLPDVPTYIPTQQIVGRQIQRSIGEDEKELPWCTICNENAVIRCVEGCDGDLYCSRCFKECHDEMDLKDHKTVEFRSPKN